MAAIETAPITAYLVQRSLGDSSFRSSCLIWSSRLSNMYLASPWGSDHETAGLHGPDRDITPPDGRREAGGRRKKSRFKGIARGQGVAGGCAICGVVAG